MSLNITSDIQKASQILANVLLKYDYRISVAESCTGGMICQYLTALAGSSRWFEYGFITYSNKAKNDLLSVSQATLDKFGAVSETVVKDMSQGALISSHADISISVSGIAGPAGGSELKPVGTVCIASAIRTNRLNNTAPNGAKNDKMHVNQNPRICVVFDTFYFSGDRNQIRQSASLAAIKMAIQNLSENCN